MKDGNADADAEDYPTFKSIWPALANAGCTGKEGQLLASTK